MTKLLSSVKKVWRFRPIFVVLSEYMNTQYLLFTPLVCRICTDKTLPNICIGIQIVCVHTCKCTALMLMFLFAK